MNAIDIGILTSTSKLPVTKLHYGGSVNSWSKITYKLDALICSGKSSYYPSEAAKVKYQKLQQKNEQLEEKLAEVQEILNGSLIETKDIKTKMNERLNDLKTETQNNFDTIKSEQNLRLNQTVLDLESSISKIKPKRAAFRWTGMKSRNGNPSE